MPCRPAEDDPSLNHGHGHAAAELLVWACERLERDPPIWVYDILKKWRSRDPRPTVSLCRVIGELPEERRAQLFSRASGWRGPHLERWWREHERWDAEREAAESRGGG